MKRRMNDYIYDIYKSIFITVQKKILNNNQSFYFIYAYDYVINNYKIIINNIFAQKKSCSKKIWTYYKR